MVHSFCELIWPRNASEFKVDSTRLDPTLATPTAQVMVQNFVVHPIRKNNNNSRASATCQTGLDLVSAEEVFSTKAKLNFPKVSQIASPVMGFAQCPMWHVERGRFRV